MISVLVRYFDPTEGIIVKVLEFTNLPNETSDTQIEYIENILTKHGLMNKVTALSADNTNTNFGGADRKGKNNVFQKLKQCLGRNQWALTVELIYCTTVASLLQTPFQRILRLYCSKFTSLLIYTL